MTLQTKSKQKCAMTQKLTHDSKYNTHKPPPTQNNKTHIPDHNPLPLYFFQKKKIMGLWGACYTPLLANQNLFSQICWPPFLSHTNAKGANWAT